MKSKHISVVVPCFNEEKCIEKNMRKIASFLISKFDDFEIIAVNDASSDATEMRLEALKRELPKLRIISLDQNRGKGGAVKKGMAKSRFDPVMFLDADLGIPIEELEKFLPKLEESADIVIASRFVPGLKIKRPVKWHRRLMEKIFRLMRMFVLNDAKIKDTQCGFKLFSRESAINIFPRLTVERFAFDAEVVFLARKMGYRIKEMPITLQNPPDSHVRLIMDPINMALDLLRIRINYSKGNYGKLKRR